MAFSEARRLLVDSPMFAESRTRPQLWAGLERYLARFIRLEREYDVLLDGASLVEYLWLGGSFVSTRLDPRNVDLTVAVNAEARSSLGGKPGSGWLTTAFQRERSARDFFVSPLEMPHRSIASVFKSHELSAPEQDYLRERGAWDDWWQRCRGQGVEVRHPTVDTAVAVRGYLEVTL